MNNKITKVITSVFLICSLILLSSDTRAEDLEHLKREYVYRYYLEELELNNNLLALIYNLNKTNPTDDRITGTKAAIAVAKALNTFLQASREEDYEKFADFLYSIPAESGEAFTQRYAELYLDLKDVHIKKILFNKTLVDETEVVVTPTPNEYGLLPGENIPENNEVVSENTFIIILSKYVDGFERLSVMTITTQNNSITSINIK